jgi:hypothetical protein
MNNSRTLGETRAQLEPAIAHDFSRFFCWLLRRGALWFFLEEVQIG